MPTPEQKIKKQIKDYITRIGGFWSIVQGGPYSKPGDPDLICCVDGRYIGIEGDRASRGDLDIGEIRGGRKGWTYRKRYRKRLRPMKDGRIYPMNMPIYVSQPVLLIRRHIPGSWIVYLPKRPCSEKRDRRRNK